MNKFLLIFALIGLSFSSYSQRIIERAAELFDKQNYVQALSYYEEAIQKNISLNAQTKLQIAVCYVVTGQAVRSIPFFADVPEALFSGLYFYYYGTALHTVGDYNRAAELYQKARISGYITHEQHRLSLACQWAMVNTQESEVTLYPLLLYPTSMGVQYYKHGLLYSLDNGQNFSDILFSDYNLDSNNVSAPLTFENKWDFVLQSGAVSFTKDYKQAFFTVAENDTLFQIYQSEWNETNWTSPQLLNINSKMYSCMHPCISPNGETLFFSSDMLYGFGGMDIYVCYRLNGEWDEPINLGEYVNTEHDEIFPYLSLNGDLYFSSDGHLGYGGFDIFKATSKQDEWNLIENLKKPINSSYHDFAYMLNPNNKQEAIFTSNRSNNKNSAFIAILSEDQIDNTSAHTYNISEVNNIDNLNNRIISHNFIDNDLSKRVYRVQLMATRNPIPPNSAIFKGLAVDRYKVNYLYKYTTGIFYDTLTVKQYCTKVQQMGFNDAFVVKYEEKDVNYSRGTYLLSEDLSTDSKFQEEGIVYRVQFLSTAEPLKQLPIIGRYAAARYRYMGLYRYTVGEFINKEEAIKLLEQVILQGYRDAFVAAFKDGERSLDIRIYSN